MNRRNALKSAAAGMLGLIGLKAATAHEVPPYEVTHLTLQVCPACRRDDNGLDYYELADLDRVPDCAWKWATLRPIAGRWYVESIQC